MLSFMNSGDAKSWKAQFLQNSTKDDGLNLGTWPDFLKEIKKAFEPYDALGDALEELIALKMGNSSIEDPPDVAIPLQLLTVVRVHSLLQHIL